GFRTALFVDCNGNGSPDDCDIRMGTSLDENENGVPDECDSPPCASPPITALQSAVSQSYADSGISVAIDQAGDRVVVGSDLANDKGFSAGAAEVCHRDGERWISEARLTAADPFAFF